GNCAACITFFTIPAAHVHASFFCQTTGQLPVTGSPKKSMIDVAFLLEVRPVVLRLCLIIRWGVRKAVTTVTTVKNTT
ncbi:hypothetical protein, partial [Escherichia coli]|uniref:hypothetical protein n=1 Tax=Escherichia coli TaxID=562 RepID=UPI001A9C4DB4